jgi:hypothetical protein
MCDSTHINAEHNEENCFLKLDDLPACGFTVLRIHPSQNLSRLEENQREAEISPMSANIRRTACHVKQPRRLLVQSPINPDTTVKPPTIMKSHPILLGTCSSAQITTMAAMPPIVARRFKTERRPVDTNATCPLMVLPAMIPADFQLHRPV